MKLLLVQPELAYDATADNPGVVARLVDPFADQLGPDDVVLLPEHFDFRGERAAYEDGISDMAVRLGCHVVGGSHHEQRPEGSVNSGVVSDSAGTIVCRYEKLRPYAEERTRVGEGNAFGELTVAGRHLLILICADFWFSDVFYRARALPDVILVPAFSVTRKPTPDYSRTLWRHLAVARAYEFGTYVGISDWAHGKTAFPASGVGGVADPTTADPEALFLPIVPANGASLYDLDFAALDTFRKDRTSRGFFWKKPGP